MGNLGSPASASFLVDDAPPLISNLAYSAFTQARAVNISYSVGAAALRAGCRHVKRRWQHTVMGLLCVASEESCFKATWHEQLPVPVAASGCHAIRLCKMMSEVVHRGVCPSRDGV